MDNTRAAFLAAIEKDRYNATIRLIFADWLDEHDEIEAAAEQRRMAGPEWIEADKWLRAYAARVNHYDSSDQAFDRLMEDIRGGTITYHGTDMHGLQDLEDADELREKASLWLQTEIDWSTFEYFSCSC